MATKQVKMGCWAQDKVTKLKGIVTAYSEMISGTRQFAIQPQGNGGNIAEGHFVDVQQLQYVKEGPVPATKPDEVISIMLGDRVQDRVTENVGVVITITVHLNGCTICGVQPTKDSKGETLEALYIDWKRLVVLEAQVIKSPFAEKPKTEPKKKPLGGPSSSMSSRRTL